MGLHSVGHFAFAKVHAISAIEKRVRKVFSFEKSAGKSHVDYKFA